MVGQKILNRLSGFIVIDKPHGWTSFDVVAKLRRLTGIRKIGHAGTLDPFATGVLVVAFNRATSLLEFMQKKSKRYEGRIRLGQISDTEDTEGHKTSIPISHQPLVEEVRLTLARHTGTLQQIPPAHSALKINGKRMYELARKGHSFERKPRTIVVHTLKLKKYNYPDLEIETEVGSGTYIRALARDIGEDLGTGAYLEKLVRTRVGAFTLEDAVDVHDVTLARLAQMLHPVSEAVVGLPKMIMSRPELNRLAAGQTIKPPSALYKETTKTIAVVDRSNNLLLLAELQRERGELKSKKLFDMSLAR